VLLTAPIRQTKVDILKADIVSRRPSKVSPMPDGLVNSMTEEEILDLMAYLESGGKKNNLAFKK
jgi:hypothetical protein